MGTKHNTKWWFVDPEGRKIGYMWPEDFEHIMVSWYGDVKWHEKFCTEFDISKTQLDRYRKGRAPIPKTLAMLINAMAVLEARKIKFPKLDAPWLPEEPIPVTNPDRA